MYEKSRFAKFWIYLMVVFWAGYLIFFGSLFAIALQDGSREPYHIINGGLLVFFVMDFIMRIPLQKIPSQELKPYMLLPIKRNLIYHYLLLRSGLNGYNFFWMFFFVPFAILSVARFYGITGVLSYCTGIWLLMLINNYWYLLCRMLISSRFLWILLPIVFYIAWGAAIFIPDDGPLFYFFINIGEGYITTHYLTFAGTLVILAICYLLCLSVVKRQAYNELNKVDDTTVQVKTVSEYSFLNRFGMVGEYMKLELKLILRNKMCKQSLYGVGVLVLSFSLLIAFTDVYEGGMKDFLVLYNFVIFSLFLNSIMSFEGNYIDGLMSRKESILSLLKAKYLVYSLGQIVPLILLIPAMITGSVAPLTCLSWLLFVPGFVYFGTFQMAVYNCSSLSLNVKTTQRTGATGMQYLISGLTFGVPLMLFFILQTFFSETTVSLIIMGIGAIFIAASPLWLNNVYHRFMKRRYINMEGFRNSRQK